MAEDAIKVRIVVLTYNAEAYLEGCLGSLRGIRTDGLDVGVIVVDNASSDRTVETIRAHHTWVTLVESAENKGFAGGNNIGIARAIAEGAEYVYLLNQDTVVDPDFLVQAVKVAEADERIGSVQSLLLLESERAYINSTGNAIHFLGFGYCLDYRRPVSEWTHTGIHELAYASGASVLYRTSVLERVGLLDEELFLYHEDLDLGWRIRLAGHSNVLAAHSRVYHKYEFSRSIAKYYFMERNRYIVLMKHFRVWTLLLLAPFLLITEFALLFVSLFTGWWKEKVKVYRYFLDRRVWRYIARARARSTLLREVGDREIVRLYTPTIRFQDVTGPFTKYIANPLMTIVWSVLRLLII